MKYKHPSNCLPIIYAMRMASIWLIVCGLPTIVDLVIMLILKDTNIGNVASTVLPILLSLVLFLIGYDVFGLIVSYIYYRKDGIKYAFRMIDTTTKLRQYMLQDISTPVRGRKAQLIAYDLSVGILTAKRFNRMLRHDYVDIHRNRITVWVRTPNNHKTDQIFDQMKFDVQTNLSSRYSDYMFSGFVHDVNYYIMSASRKK